MVAENIWAEGQLLREASVEDEAMIASIEAAAPTMLVAAEPLGDASGLHLEPRGIRPTR